MLLHLVAFVVSWHVSCSSSNNIWHYHHFLQKFVSRQQKLLSCAILLLKAVMMSLAFRWAWLSFCIINNDTMLQDLWFISRDLRLPKYKKALEIKDYFFAVTEKYTFFHQKSNKDATKDTYKSCKHKNTGMHFIFKILLINIFMAREKNCYFNLLPEAEIHQFKFKGKLKCVFFHCCCVFSFVCLITTFTPSIVRDHIGFKC